MLKLINFLAFFLVFFISFTDAFALGPWLKLWVIFVILLVPLSFFYILGRQTLLVECYQKEDTLIILMFFGLLVSSLFNPSIRNFNYLLAYLFIFGITYLYLKGVFYNFINYEKLLNINTLAVIFVASFSVIDFSLWFFFDFDVQSIIPRSRVPKATYLGMFRRSYGFATEPTILAFYFNTLGIIGVWNLWYRFDIQVYSKILFTSICFIGWLSTFSGVAIPALPFSLFLCFFLVILKKPAINKKSIYGVAIVCVFIIGMLPIYKKEVTYYFSPIYKKVTLQQESAGSRPIRWLHDLKLVSLSPIVGHGPGYASESGRGSSVNWYLFLTMEGGLISSVPVLLFMLFSFMRIYLSKIPGRLWFMSAFMAGAIHLAAISTFFHPFLWMLLIIFFTYDKQMIYSIVDPNNETIY